MVQSLHLGFAMADDLTGLPPRSDALSGNERVFVSVFNCSGFSPYLESLVSSPSLDRILYNAQTL